MKQYEFTAATAKADMIMGLGLPAIYGFPILAVWLGVFYSGQYKFFQTRLELLGLVMLPALLFSMAMHVAVRLPFTVGRKSLKAFWASIGRMVWERVKRRIWPASWLWAMRFREPLTNIM